VLTVHADSPMDSAKTGSTSVRRDTADLPFLLSFPLSSRTNQANRSRCERGGAASSRLIRRGGVAGFNGDAVDMEGNKQPGRRPLGRERRGAQTLSGAAGTSLR
jgi:hypothetical protein